MSDIFRDFDKKNEVPKIKIPKFATGVICNDAIPKLDAFSQIDEIVKDIVKKKDNAIAMEFTKYIGELLRKNGVVPKMTEYTGSFETNKTFGTRYGVTIDELDFSEHDKVFEDKIADLQQRIRELIKEKDEYKRKCNDFGFKNQELKKDYKTASELLGKYQQENERLKKRIIELENFSCQAEQETESLVEELKQCIAELESENKQLKHDIDKMATSTSKWIERAVEWQQKCEKLESKETSELPFDPLECANYLINATYERETSELERGFYNCPEKVSSDKYTVDELEQIAEHLLVYCKHNKESE